MLGVDIDDFDVKKLATLSKESSLQDVLALFDESEKDVDEGSLSSVLDNFGSLTSLLGDNEDDDDDDGILDNVLDLLSHGKAEKKGGFAGLLGAVIDVIDD
jgi:hypothetical protein